MAGRKKIYKDDLNPEIKRLYEEELQSMYAISQKLNVHPQVIKRKLLSMGVHIRNKSEAMILYYTKYHNKET